MIRLYGEGDIREAERRFRGAWMLLAAVLAPLLAGYVLALVKGSYAVSLALALLMLIWSLSAGDLLLTPRRRYLRFLRELNRGLRRQTECAVIALEDGILVQDGANVRALQVRMPDGDSRIFYLNAAKAEFLPEANRHCTVVSCGRHVVEFIEN